MPHHVDVWTGLVERHGLQRLPMARLASWPFIDGWFGTGDDMVQSTIKIRQAGFGDCVDSHESFLGHLQHLRDLAIVP